jgi:hypothetical protein
MQIHNTIDALMRLLQRHELRDRPKIIAEMEIARRLDARKHELGEGLHCYTAPISKRALSQMAGLSGK